MILPEGREIDRVPSRAPPAIVYKVLYFLFFPKLRENKPTRTLQCIDYTIKNSSAGFCGICMKVLVKQSSHFAWDTATFWKLSASSTKKTSPSMKRLTPKYLRLVKESPFPMCMNEPEMEFTDGSVSQKKLFVLGWYCLDNKGRIYYSLIISGQNYLWTYQF